MENIQGETFTKDLAKRLTLCKCLIHNNCYCYHHYYLNRPSSIRPFEHHTLSWSKINFSGSHPALKKWRINTVLATDSLLSHFAASRICVQALRRTVLISHRELCNIDPIKYQMWKVLKKYQLKSPGSRDCVLIHLVPFSAWHSTWHLVQLRDAEWRNN